jgi:hypothetical protein
MSLLKRLSSSAVKGLAGAALLIAIILTFSTLFAYFSGDRNDRAAITTSILLSMHEMKVVGDADLCKWLLRDHGISSDENVYSELRTRAQTNPLWFKAFIGHLDASLRERLLRKLKSVAL